MGIRQSQTADDIVKFYEATMFELPLAAFRRLLGGEERSLNEAGWKAYDAWIRIANETTNRVYANRGFGEASGRVMETMLRAQRMGDAMASAFFGNLWPAIGLPAANEVRSLRDEVSALREDLREATNRAASGDAAHPGTEEGLHIVRSRVVATRSAAGKENVAA
jgi:hypothetical protein